MLLPIGSPVLPLPRFFPLSTITSVVLSKLTPPEFGWATLPAGLVGALVGAGARGRGATPGTPKGQLGTGLLGMGLLGALGAFAVLTLGIIALAYAVQLEWFRFPGASLEDFTNIYTAYLYRREAAL